MKTNSPDDHPLLVTAPGERLADAITGFAGRCRSWTGPDGRDLAQPAGPHRLRIEHAERGFDLPAGLFTVIEAKEGIVRRVLATPHVGYVNGEAALALIEQLAHILAKKGWVRMLDKGHAKIPRRLPRAHEERLGLWRNAHWVAELRIRRAVHRGSFEATVLQLAGDGYLVTLSVWDEKAGFSEDAVSKPAARAIGP
jgi:hypothetical protein